MRPTKSYRHHAKISVIVYVHNTGSRLTTCLKSILDQTWDDFELLCVNDASTDNSLDTIHQFSSQDARFIILDKQYSGYSASLNLALKQAKGEYVCFVDGSDYLDPEALNKLYQAAQEFNPDIIQGSYSIVQSRPSKDSDLATDKPIYTSAPIAPSRQVISAKQQPSIFQTPVVIWSTLYRLDFIRENDIEFLPVIHDASTGSLSFAFKALVLSHSTVLLPDILYYHYYSAMSATPTQSKALTQEYEEIETFLCERGLFSDFGAAMSANKFQSYYRRFSQLPPNLAKEFFQKWRPELAISLQEALFQRPYFGRRDWSALQTILKHPRLGYWLLRVRVLLFRHSVLK